MALKRPEHPLPDDVQQALALSDLLGAYAARPPRQREQYVDWITESRREVTRRKRIRQMLDELDAGDAFKGAPWSGGKKPKSER